MTPLTPIAGTGRAVLLAFAALGRIAIFAARSIAYVPRPPFYGREFVAALTKANV